MAAEQDNKAQSALTVDLCGLLVSTHVSMPTHDPGGILDVVATRDDVPAPSVDVVLCFRPPSTVMVGRLPMSRPPPVYRSVDVRQWRLLDHNAFYIRLASSSLCNSYVWSETSVCFIWQLALRATYPKTFISNVFAHTVSLIGAIYFCLHDHT